MKRMTRAVCTALWSLIVPLGSGCVAPSVAPDKDGKTTAKQALALAPPADPVGETLGGRLEVEVWFSTDAPPSLLVRFPAMDLPTGVHVEEQPFDLNKIVPDPNPQGPHHGTYAVTDEPDVPDGGSPSYTPRSPSRPPFVNYADQWDIMELGGVDSPGFTIDALRVTYVFQRIPGVDASFNRPT